MSIHWPKPGLNNTAEYQTSGHAFAVPSAGGPIRVDLDFVSSAVVACATNADAQISFFDANDVMKTVSLGAAGSHRFEVKCIRFQLTSSAGNVGAVAELTNIPSSSFVAIAHGSLGTVS